MIPEAAVEAAAKRIATNEGGMFAWELYAEDARMILEAAAPQMQAQRSVDSVRRLARYLDTLAEGDRHYADLIRKALEDTPRAARPTP